jgi:hypothetical protein
MSSIGAMWNGRVLFADERDRELPEGGSRQMLYPPTVFGMVGDGLLQELLSSARYDLRFHWAGV